MQRILAIAGLTWKAALRFKLFLVIAVLLIAAVVGLPLVIRDDQEELEPQCGLPRQSSDG